MCRIIQREVLAESKLQSNLQKGVVVSSIVSKIIQQSSMTMSSNLIGTYVKLIFGLGVNKYVDELLDYIASAINPKDIGVSPQWIEEMLLNIPEVYMLLRLNTYEIHASDTTAVARMPRPTPDQARLILSSELKRLDGCKDIMKQINDKMIDNRNHVAPVLEKTLGVAQAVVNVRIFENQLARVFFNKTRTADFNAGVTGSKLDAEKISTIHNNWLLFLLDKYPNLVQTLEAASIKVIKPDDDNNAPDDEVRAQISASSFRSLATCLGGSDVYIYIYIYLHVCLYCDTCVCVHLFNLCHSGRRAPAGFCRRLPTFEITNITKTPENLRLWPQGDYGWPTWLYPSTKSP
jgi:hypothetical protein